MDKESVIFVAGASGLVGSAMVRALQAAGFHNILKPTHREVNLIDQQETFRFFSDHRPEYIFLCAAKVAGIQGNIDEPAAMIQTNLLIETNVIGCAHELKAKKLMFFGSSCIYPKHALQPIQEDYLLTGPLEPSNEFYAIAKIAGLKLCQAYRKQYGDNFISVMPTNLYGINDNYKIGGHVIPELIWRFHLAKNTTGPIKVWGNGLTRREFLYADDLARACIYVMQGYDQLEPINIGFGFDTSIAELVEAVADTVGVDRKRLEWDPDAPVGTPRKWLDSSKVKALGWTPLVQLRDGLKLTYEDFLDNHAKRI